MRRFQVATGNLPVCGMIKKLKVGDRWSGCERLLLATITNHTPKPSSARLPKLGSMPFEEADDVD
jgi:hypothetical protein